jgi:hypothetical protein
MSTAHKKESYKFAAHTEKKKQYKKLSSAVKIRSGKKEAISKKKTSPLRVDSDMFILYEVHTIKLTS